VVLQRGEIGRVDDLKKENWSVNMKVGGAYSVKPKGRENQTVAVKGSGQATGVALTEKKNSRSLGRLPGGIGKH